MTIRDTAKVLLQKAIARFLSGGKPQRRFALFHEILPQEERMFDAILSFLDRSSSLDVTLTFDDGFSSSVVAIKKLQKRKALFFICPEFINSAENPSAWQNFFHERFLRKEGLADKALHDAVRPATWDDLRELVRLGHTIGSHTMTHARLSKIISLKELEREVIGSADAIEDQLQVPVDAIAYPFGDIQSIDARAYKIIQKRYRYCFTGIRGNNESFLSAAFRWRDTIHLYWPLEYITSLLKGGFDGYYFFKRKKIQKILSQH